MIPLPGNHGASTAQHPTRSRAWRDAALLLAAGLAWLAIGRWHPGPGYAALLGLASTLLLCKLLLLPPLLRALIAPLPLLLPQLVQHGPFDQAAFAGVLSAATGYIAFTLLRRGAYALRRFRFRTPDGSDAGWDYGQLLLAGDRLRARWQPARRILFPPTNLEAWLREGFAHRRDQLVFAELVPDNLAGFDLVVPLTLAEIASTRELGALLRDNPLPLPSPASVAVCDDKLAFQRAMLESGFASFVPALTGEPVFPYVLKKRYSEWGTGTHIISCPDDEQHFGEQLADPEYFRQAFIPGRTEYAAHLLVRNGQVAAAITVEYGYAHDLHKKCDEQPPRHRRLRRATHLRLFRDVLASIGYEGICCVNYKLQDGQPRIFEVNPRPGSSLAPWFFVMLRAL